MKLDQRRQLGKFQWQANVYIGCGVLVVVVVMYMKVWQCYEED